MISEDKTIVGTTTSVTISGAAKQSAINGVYVPTADIFGGQVVYKSEDADIWLEYHLNDAKWYIVSEKGKGGTMMGQYAHSTISSVKLCGKHNWEIWQTDKYVTESLTLCQEKPPAMAAEPFHDNFERSVKETQIRLWCYRKVVHKAFCDTMAKFVRYQFPRRLKDDVEAAIHKSLLAGAEDAEESDKDSCLLLTLMAESEELSRKRKALQTSVRKHEALKVMMELKRQKLA